jgi:hypothetical protein
MFGRSKPKLVDLSEIANSAVDAFLNGEQQQSENGHREKREPHRVGALGTVALGVALAAGARAAYSRVAGRVDLEQVAETVEERLKS